MLDSLEVDRGSVQDVIHAYAGLGIMPNSLKRRIAEVVSAGDMISLVPLRNYYPSRIDNLVKTFYQAQKNNDLSGHDLGKKSLEWLWKAGVLSGKIQRDFKSLVDRNDLDIGPILQLSPAALSKANLLTLYRKGVSGETQVFDLVTASAISRELQGRAYLRLKTKSSKERKWAEFGQRPALASTRTIHSTASP